MERLALGQHVHAHAGVCPGRGVLPGRFLGHLLEPDVARRSNRGAVDAKQRVARGHALKKATEVAQRGLEPHWNMSSGGWGEPAVRLSGVGLVQVRSVATSFETSPASSSKASKKISIDSEVGLVEV